MLEALESLFGLNGDPPILTIGEVLFSLFVVVVTVLVVRLIRDRRASDRRLEAWATAHGLEFGEPSTYSILGAPELIDSIRHLTPLRHMYTAPIFPRLSQKSARNVIRGRWQGQSVLSFDCWFRKWYWGMLLPSWFSVVIVETRELPPRNAINGALLDNWHRTESKTRIGEFWAERCLGKLVLYNGRLFSVADYRAAFDLAARLLGSPPSGREPDRQRVSEHEPPAGGA